MRLVRGGARPLPFVFLLAAARIAGAQEPARNAGTQERLVPFFPDAIPAAIRAETDGAAALETVRELGRFHRVQGSPGYAAAAEHIRAKAAAAGLADAAIERLPADGKTRYAHFLSYLGFTINPKLTPLAKHPGEQVGVSEERLDVIDADVIVFATEKERDIANLKKVPTFKFLEAVKNQSAVYTDPTLSGAMYFTTPLSFQYILDKLTPALKDAVAGHSPETMIGG